MLIYGKNCDLYSKLYGIFYGLNHPVCSSLDATWDIWYLLQIIQNFYSIRGDVGNGSVVESIEFQFALDRKGQLLFLQRKWSFLWHHNENVSRVIIVSFTEVSWFKISRVSDLVEKVPQKTGT